MSNLNLTSRTQLLRSFFLGGLLPVIAFTVIEEKYGTMHGLIAGMIFGAGEILWEWRTQKKVSGLTWGGNGMIFVLGGISLLSNDGIWFKLQPALIEGVMALALWGSIMIGKPLMITFMDGMLKKQGLERKPLPAVDHALRGMTFRIGIFFSAHAALATWAAFRWSTEGWAFLKGIGFTVSLIAYMVIEGKLLKSALRASAELMEHGL